MGAAILAGEILLKNGAETYRVEETMEHIAKSCGVSQVECFVIPTGVFLTVIDESGASVTTLRRIRNRTINLDRISKINELSRRMAGHKMTARDAMPILERIARERTGFSWRPSILASGVVGAGTAVLQNGAPGEILAAFFAAAVVRGIAHIVSRMRGVTFMFQFLGGMAAASIGVAVSYVWPGLVRDAIIIGGIIPLVPGMAITNSIRDVMAGDLVSGLSRGLEAALTVSAVAMGVLLILFI